MLKKFLFASAAFMLALSLFHTQARAQSASPAPDDLPKYEVGFHFTSLTYNDERTEPGLGARFTYNLNKSVALEAEGDVLPHNARAFFLNGGRAVEGFFGVKIGRRHEKYGLFAKARPGLISFTQGRFDYVPNGSGSAFPFDLRTERTTNFAMDVGGVLELYPTKRIVTRFDLGDTIIRYGATNFNTIVIPGSGPPLIVPLTVPTHRTHNLQFTAGIGFRF
ncbi:MAG: hypothetical protein WCB68_04720 [Pyrinomonadaceae bacterium]